MRPIRTIYEVWCLLCSTEVGRLVDGRLRRHPGCAGALPRPVGRPRCCHCGGSLYVETRSAAAADRLAAASA